MYRITRNAISVSIAIVTLENIAESLVFPVCDRSGFREQFDWILWGAAFSSRLKTNARISLSDGQSKDWTHSAILRKETLRSTISLGLFPYVFSYKYLALSFSFSLVFPSRPLFRSLHQRPRPWENSLTDRVLRYIFVLGGRGGETSPLCSDFVKRNRESADEERR